MDMKTKPKIDQKYFNNLAEEKATKRILKV